MLGVHASAQAIIHFGKIARKHGLTGVCLDSLRGGMGGVDGGGGGGGLDKTVLRITYYLFHFKNKYIILQNY